MSNVRHFDLLIIGSGPGGYATAAEAVKAGLTVGVVESGEPGGTCLNCGCIPTKALCHSASLSPVPTWQEAIERKNRIVADLRQGVSAAMKGAELISGRARFEGKTVKVNDEAYTADRIIVATGSAPASLPIEGAELAMDSTTLLEASTPPQSIIIIGGGVIGLEMASLLQPFGVKVSVLEYCREILPAMDSDIARRLKSALKRRGISITTQAEVKSITHSDHETLTVNYLSRGKECSTSAQAVLMAVGRRAVIPEGLDVELTPRGFIKVDPHSMATSLPGVYAVGDVNGLTLLAHAAEAQGRVALGLDMPLSPCPAAVFTNPECATVGMTEEECENNDLDFTVGTALFASNGKAVASDASFGMVKAIVERTSLRLLGCHICGAHAADLIMEPALTIAANLPATAIVRTIHAHPTLGETLKAAVADAMK